MQLKPAAGHGELQTGAVLGGRRLVYEQEWTVDLLDVDAVILEGFESPRMLHKADRGGPACMTEEIVKLGTAGAICIVLLWVIFKSEQREKAKDARIQMLENKLNESYDERIAAADTIAESNVGLRNALDALTIEIRARLVK